MCGLDQPVEGDGAGMSYGELRAVVWAALVCVALYAAAAPHGVERTAEPVPGWFAGGLVGAFLTLSVALGVAGARFESRILECSGLGRVEYWIRLTFVRGSLAVGAGLLAATLLPTMPLRTVLVSGSLILILGALPGRARLEAGACRD